MMHGSLQCAYDRRAYHDNSNRNLFVTLPAHCERFVRSIKEEAINQMVILGERTLYYAIQQYLTHYHMERNHQGLENRLIAREDVGGQTGPVIRREHLGGLLSYYHRDAA